VAFLGRDWFVSNLLATLLGTAWAALTGAARVVSMPVRTSLPDLLFVKELIEAGRLRTVVDRRYPLAEISAAHGHAQSGRKKGHVLVICESGGSSRPPPA
jgi:NADPH:quinone reductase-like Zn-dependent oxidoreductase